MKALNYISFRIPSLSESPSEHNRRYDVCGEELNNESSVSFVLMITVKNKQWGKGNNRRDLANSKCHTERPRFDSGTVWQLAIRRAKCASFALSIISQSNGCENGVDDWGPIPARNIPFSVLFRRVRSQSDPISEKTSIYYRPVHWRAVPMLITQILAEQNCGNCSAKRRTQALSRCGLFFKMSDGFHGTTRVNVISCMPTRKARPSLSQKCSSAVCTDSHVPNFSQIGQKMLKVHA